MQAFWLCTLLGLCGLYFVREGALILIDGRAVHSVSDRLLAFGSTVGSFAFGAAIAFAAAESSWYSVLCGICSLAVLTLLGAAWTAMSHDGELQRRGRQFAGRAWWAVLFSYAFVVAGGIAVQHGSVEQLVSQPWLCGLAVATFAGFIGSRLCLGIRFDLGVAASAFCIIASLIATAAAGQVLPVWSAAGIALGCLAIRTPALLPAVQGRGYRAGLRQRPAIR